MNLKRLLLIGGLIAFIIAFIEAVGSGHLLTSPLTWESVGGILLGLGILL